MLSLPRLLYPRRRNREVFAQFSAKFPGHLVILFDRGKNGVFESCQGHWARAFRSHFQKRPLFEAILVMLEADWSRRGRRLIRWFRSGDLKFRFTMFLTLFCEKVQNF